MKEDHQQIQDGTNHTLKPAKTSKQNISDQIKKISAGEAEESNWTKADAGFKLTS